MVVRIDGSVDAKTREGARAGDETAQQSQIVINTEFGRVSRCRQIRNSLAQPPDVEGTTVAQCDEPQNGRVQAVGGEHRPAAWIDGDEGSNDAAQGF